MIGLPDENFRTVRGYQLMSQGGGQLTPALEDYLEMVYRQCAQHGYARIGKLSELLHVKPSSASKMISKLSQLGHVEYNRYELILLTDKGRQTGEYLLKRHETIACFLKLIGCESPLEETELIEHSLSGSTVAALDCLLDYFRSDSAVLSGYAKHQSQWTSAE